MVSLVVLTALVAPLGAFLLATRRADGGRIPDQIVALRRPTPECLVVHLHEDPHADRVERPRRRRDLLVAAYCHRAVNSTVRARLLLEVDNALVPPFAGGERELIADEGRIEEICFVLVDGALQDRTRRAQLVAWV